MNLESPKEQTGISIFDVDQTEEADPSAVTQVTESAAPDIQIDAGGSGSGLLDLTREADDTSLGQDLLDGVQKDGSTASETKADLEGSAEAGALFESATPEADAAGAATPAMAAALAEPYDGTWSGIGGGMALGMIAVAAFTLALTIIGLSGMTDAPLVRMIAGNPTAWIGGGAAAILLFAIIGWMLGRGT
jgi:predicted lipid-binding transport protein (Tim44 family)